MSDHRSLPAARFGAVLGHAPGGVPVYSSDYASVDKTELPNRAAFRHYVDGIFMGYKWQCVEFARAGCTSPRGGFSATWSMAYDIFQLRTLRDMASGAELPLRSFRNGGEALAGTGALLIWNEGGEFVVTGHVAVVTEVFADRVRCVEQNVDNRPGRTAAPIPATRGDRRARRFVLDRMHLRRRHGAGLGDPDRRRHPCRDHRRCRPPAVQHSGAAGRSEGGREGQLWLDPEKPDEAAYMAKIGGCKSPSSRRTKPCISASARPPSAN
jgi:glutathionylspermidine amidase/synthetase